MYGQRDVEGACCEFCRQDRPGQVYHYFAGQHLHTEKRSFLSSTREIKSIYQGIQKYGVFVCNACTANMRKRRYLKGGIGWTLTSLACAGGAAYVYVTEAGGDQMWAVLGALALFVGLTAALGVVELLGAFGLSSNIDDIIVNRLKTDPRRVADQGDSFFTEAEYRVLFQDGQEPAEALTAEQLLALDAGRSKRKPPKEEELKECPHCAGKIPTYAQACRHCKKILG